MKMEVEIRAIRDCQGPPGAGRGKEVFFPRAFRGSTALRTLTSSLQNCERINFCCLKYMLVEGICYGSPRKLMQPGFMLGLGRCPLRPDGGTGSGLREPLQLHKGRKCCVGRSLD